MFSNIFFSVHGNGDLLIAPELVAYATSNITYSSIPREDRVRLNIIRLEVLRIRSEILRQNSIGRIPYAGESSRNATEHRSSNIGLASLRIIYTQQSNSYDYEKFHQTRNPFSQRMAALIDRRVCKYLIHNFITFSKLSNFNFHFSHFQLKQTPVC